jgi:hypothetical protein
MLLMFNKLTRDWVFVLVEGSKGCSPMMMDGQLFFEKRDEAVEVARRQGLHVDPRGMVHVAPLVH